MAIGGREAERAGDVEDAVEVEVDGGSGFLGDFVLDGDVEVVCTVEEAFEGALVLGEDGGADARDVVEVNAAEGEVAEVLGGGDLDVVERGAERGGPGLEGPAEEALLAADLVLKAAGAVEVLDALVDGFVEADDHGGCRP